MTAKESNDLIILFHSYLEVFHRMYTHQVDDRRSRPHKNLNDANILGGMVVRCEYTASEDLIQKLPPGGTRWVLMLLDERRQDGICGCGDAYRLGFGRQAR